MRTLFKSGIFPKEMSKSLRQVFEARQEGDYREASKIDEATARATLLSADEFVSAIEHYLQDRKNK